MSNSYYYTVLKYRHSFFLGEVVNVGLLLYFKDEKEFKFIYPSKLERISHLYPDIEIRTIKYYLTLFERKAENLTKAWRGTIDGVLNVEFNKIINDEFLIEDGSALFFDQIKSGINVNKERIANYYYAEYFYCYDILKHTQRKDEEYINKTVRSKLVNRTHSPESYKRLEINKRLSNGFVEETFKLGWQNGHFNLIVPLAFDLQEKQSIENKSLTWFGKFNFLGELAVDQGFHFDILTTKPVSSELGRAYLNALEILENSKAPITVFKEDEIDDYITKVGSYLSLD